MEARHARDVLIRTSTKIWKTGDTDMTTLHLGVVDLPYSYPPARGRRRRVKSGTQTTGDVAGWLEDEYHVMEVFFNQHSTDVSSALETSVRGALENVMLGGPAGDPFAGAGGAIEHAFRQFIDLKEMDALGYPGVPTVASLQGVSHRFKDRRGVPGRPSFVDTGLYETSFRAWVD
jgi:hypothetical protein